MNKQNSTGIALSSFLKQPTVLSSLIILSLMLILSVALLVLRWPQIPPEVPLYFSRPWGESQLAPSESLILLPTLSVLIYLANFTLALLLARGDKLITEILIKGALFAAGILLYSMVRIILLIS